MVDRTLGGCRILVVEDEFMLADELHMVLEAAGALVLGPVGSVEEALRCIAMASTIDGAILDVNLDGELVFPVADHLAARGVPFVFLTGYGSGTAEGRHAGRPTLGKPLKPQVLIRALAGFGTG